MKAGLLLVSLVLMSGCAFTDINMKLPTSGLDNPDATANGMKILVEVPFADEREIKRCGMQKNGYNQDTADATCDKIPMTWIAEMLQNGLRSYGFEVAEGDSQSGANLIRVQGTLLKLFVEPVIGTWSGSLEADLQVALRVTTETGLEAERMFFVKGVKKGVMASITPEYELALRKGTEQILDDMVLAILELTREYPEIGK